MGSNSPRHIAEGVDYRSKFVEVVEKNGAAEGTRTPDPIITNDVLYQLSYSGIPLLCGPTMALLVTVRHL